MGMDPNAAAAGATAPAASQAGSSSSSTALVVAPNGAPGAPGAGRRLKILEHRVHKVEARTKESGEPEEELIVSNLRPFTLKVGVHDAAYAPMLDCSLPLRAMLLYENGLPVRQTSSSEPLLVGETDVVALQGAATFKLRITSLSSHRDKQRFRIQVAPQDVDLQLSEPSLCVVTDPMKSVTKLGRSSGGAPALPPPVPPALTGGEGGAAAAAEGLKRKYHDVLQDHAMQLQTLNDTQAQILSELQALMALAKQRQLASGGANGGAHEETKPSAA
jgi:hypothetical protein